MDLIIDPHNSFPSSTLLFNNPDYYVDEGTLFLGRYDLSCCKEIKEEYDTICLIGDLSYINDDASGEWGGAKHEKLDVVNPFMIEQWQKIAAKLKHVKYNKLIFIDYGDFPLSSRGFKKIEEIFDRELNAAFKREYRRTCTFDYNERTHAFPFVVFGDVDPTWLLYKEYREKTKEDLLKKIQLVYFASSDIMRASFDDRFRCCYRADFLLKLIQIQKLNSVQILAYKNKMTFDEYMNTYDNFRFFFHLNGSGHLCKSFFEGLSRGSLMIQQKMDVVFPFENGEDFSKYTIFYSMEEFVENYKKLLKEDIFEDALNKQKQIINKYFTPEWIKGYINSKING